MENEIKNVVPGLVDIDRAVYAGWTIMDRQNDTKNPTFLGLSGFKGDRGS